jgi:hypothetical protein
MTKRVMIILAAIISLCAQALAVTEEPNGTTSYSTEFVARDTGTGDFNNAPALSNYVYYYWLGSRAATAGPYEVSTLANITAAYSSGGAYSRGHGGVLRFDVPNVVMAAGVGTIVTVQLVDPNGGDTIPAREFKLTYPVQTGDSYAVVTNGTYGLAKLVRSATPANALAVDSGGVASSDLVKVHGDAIPEPNKPGYVPSIAEWVTNGVDVGRPMDQNDVNDSVASNSGSADVNSLEAQLDLAKQDINDLKVQLAAARGDVNDAKAYAADANSAATAAKTASEKIDSAAELRTLLYGHNVEGATEPNQTAGNGYLTNVTYGLQALWTAIGLVPELVGQDPNVAKASTALSNVVWPNSKAAYLDMKISDVNGTGGSGGSSQTWPK